MVTSFLLHDLQWMCVFSHHPASCGKHVRQMQQRQHRKLAILITSMVSVEGGYGVRMELRNYSHLLSCSLFFLTDTRCFLAERALDNFLARGLLIELVQQRDFAVNFFSWWRYVCGGVNGRRLVHYDIASCMVVSNKFKYRGRTSAYSS